MGMPTLSIFLSFCLSIVNSLQYVTLTKPKMDALAAAADAAAMAAVEEELLEQQEQFGAEVPLTSTFFDDTGFGRINASEGITLVQLKSKCAANDCCRMVSVPLSNLIRCDACGYSSHRSCQRTLSPELPELRYNRVCNGCVVALGLLPEKLGDTSRSSAVSSHDSDLKAFVNLQLRDAQLQLVTRNKYNEFLQDFDDGAYDDVLDEDEEEDEQSGKNQNEEEMEDDGKLLRFYPLRKQVPQYLTWSFFRFRPRWRR
jgi:hypothetical protein